MAPVGVVDYLYSRALGWFTILTALRGLTILTAWPWGVVDYLDSEALRGVDNLHSVLWGGG